jgi:hypothetical protein
MVRCLQFLRHRRFCHVILRHHAGNKDKVPSAGHPEGFLEAFSSIYRAFADDIRALKAGKKPVGNYPGIQDGIDEMKFLAALVENSNGDKKWTKLK